MHASTLGPPIGILLWVVAGARSYYEILTFFLFLIIVSILLLFPAQLVCSRPSSINNNAALMCTFYAPVCVFFVEEKVFVVARER